MQAWHYHYRGCGLFEFINSAPKHLTKNQIKQLANSSRVTARNVCYDIDKIIRINTKLNFDVKLYKSRSIKNR